MKTGHRLPRAAADKLSAMSIAADDARTLAHSSVARGNELRKAFNTSSDARERGGIEHELTRLRASQETHNRRHGDLSATLANIRRWLSELPRDAVLETVKAATPEMQDGEDVAAALERIRHEIAEAQQELRDVRAAPLSKAEMKKAAARHVEQLAEQGRPRIATNGGALAIDFSDAQSFGPPNLNRMVAVLAWWDRGWLLKRLHAEIDAMPEPRLALSADEKKERAAELTDDLDRLERTEEALVEVAHAEGRDVTRRANASPAAVLGVKVKRQRARAA